MPASALKELLTLVPLAFERTAVQLCPNQTIILHPHANLGRKGPGSDPCEPGDLWAGGGDGIQ